jgi:hypothetical protein
VDNSDRIRPRKRFRKTKGQIVKPLTERELHLTTAKDASLSQIEKLKYELGGVSNADAMQFMAWSHGLYSDAMSLSRWDCRKGKVWASSIFWHRAIEMAMTGQNDFYTAEQLIEMSGM